jgi:hypothetical protein
MYKEPYSIIQCNELVSSNQDLQVVTENGGKNCAD